MKITGTNLTAASEVKFGSAKATGVKVESATEVKAESPAGTGTVDVTVTTPGGTSTPSLGDQFTYIVPAPTVTKVAPTSGPAAGGTAVTITGTNLTGASEVKFGADRRHRPESRIGDAGHRDLPGRLGHRARDREHPRRHERHLAPPTNTPTSRPPPSRKSNRPAARPPAGPK